MSKMDVLYEDLRKLAADKKIVILVAKQRYPCAPIPEWLRRRMEDDPIIVFDYITLLPRKL